MPSGEEVIQRMPVDDHVMPRWAATTSTVADALRSRKSIRAYLPTPVPRAEVEALLEVAARAPSGTNTQPWKVYALSGVAKQKLSDAIEASLADSSAPLDQSGREPNYPDNWPSPFLERRRKVGWDLYGLLGITRESRDRINDQRNRNFRFYDAPVGLIFTVDRRLKQGSWMDYGMFLQSIMLLARERGLATCPQAAFSQFADLIARHLDVPETEQVICGMAIGHADPDALVNTLETVREPVSRFATFAGWE